MDIIKEIQKIKLVIYLKDNECERFKCLFEELKSNPDIQEPLVDKMLESLKEI